MNTWEVSPLSYLEKRPPEYPDSRLFSQYVTVRDGTRLAVDIHLPGSEKNSTAFPAILILTPYYRRFARQPGSPPAERRAACRASASCKRKPLRHIHRAKLG